MISLPRGAVRASEYHHLAIAAAELAETSLLANVREKHALAAARWVALAIPDEQRRAAQPLGSGRERRRRSFQPLNEEAP